MGLLLFALEIALTIGFWDGVLVAVVSLQATAVAYQAAPRWKALLLTLPLPFTTIALALGRPIDASNVLSLVVLFGYTLSVQLLHGRWRLPIVLAIVMSVVGYSVTGGLLARVVPETDVAFWVSAVGMMVLGLALRRVVPNGTGVAYRTPLPLWQKLPVVFAVVALLVVIKNSLEGFATLFPLLSTVGAYEVRRDLWLLVGTVPRLMCALVPLMVVVRLAQPTFGLGFALVLGWAVFVPILLFLTRKR